MVLVTEVQPGVAKEMVNFKLPALGDGLGTVAVESTCVVEEGAGITKALSIAKLANVRVAILAVKAKPPVSAKVSTLTLATLSSLLLVLTKPRACTIPAVSARLVVLAEAPPSAECTISAFCTMLAKAPTTTSQAIGAKFAVLAKSTTTALLTLFA
jgi:hypothetical protein